MNATIIGGLITAIGAIICQILINKSNREKQKLDEAVREAKLDDKLERIEERLDEHNNYAAKIGAMEQSLLLIQQDIKYIKEGKLI